MRSQLNVRIPPSELQAARETAREYGLPLSHLIRVLLHKENASQTRERQLRNAYPMRFRKTGQGLDD